MGALWLIESTYTLHQRSMEPAISIAPLAAAEIRSADRSLCCLLLSVSFLSRSGMSVCWEAQRKIPPCSKETQRYHDRKQPLRMRTSVGRGHSFTGYFSPPLHSPSLCRAADARFSILLFLRFAPTAAHLPAEGESIPFPQSAAEGALCCLLAYLIC